MPSPVLTITFSLQTLAGAASPGAGIVVTLCNYGSVIPKVAGTSILSDVQITPTIDVNGNGSFTPWGNDVIAPGPNLTFYMVQVKNSQGGVIQANIYQFTGSGTFDLSNLSPLNLNPPLSPIPPNAVLVNPTGPQSITGFPLTSVLSNCIVKEKVIFNGSTSGTLSLQAAAVASGILTLPAATDTLIARNTTDTLTNKTLTSPILVTPYLGAAIASSYNGVIWVDGVTYTTIQAAYNALPATGGVVMVPPGYSETVAASWTLNKSYTRIHFTGAASLAFGVNTISVPAGITGVSISSNTPWGYIDGTDPHGVMFKYTGNGTFITVGASTADTHGCLMSDIAIFLNSAGAAAVGLKMVRCPIGSLTRLTVIGPGGAITQQGIILDGTGNFTGVKIEQPRINGVLNGIQFTGSGVNAANACQVIGGSISSPATGASIGLDFQAGSGGNVVAGTDIESHAIGINLAGTSSGNYIVARSEGNTSGATLGAGTTANEIHLINSADPITDNGTNNVTAPTPQNPSYPLIKASVIKGIGASALVVQDGSGASRLFANGSTNLFVNLGGGSTLFGPNASPVFSTAGIASNYNQIATVANGLPAQYALVDLTAQTAAKTATLLYAVPAAGQGWYRVSWVATITQAATTSCVLGGSSGFRVQFTSPTDSVVKTSNPTTTTEQTSSVNATGTTVSGTFNVYAKANTNINYLFDYTSVGATPMAYELHIRCEAM